MMNFLAVALGGALGAMGRYAMTLTLEKNTTWLPLATLSVNVLGSLAIGLVWAYLQQRQHNDFFRLLIGVGVLGGFTTFSSFSLETMQLLASGEAIRALVNIGLNLLLCLMAVAIGMWLGRWVF